MYISTNPAAPAYFAFTISLERPREKKEDPRFGPLLAVLRKARGLTQIQLAEATGSAQRPISYYENDDGVPPVSTDKLLGLKTPKAAPAHEEDSETRGSGRAFRWLRSCRKRISAALSA